MTKPRQIMARPTSFFLLNLITLTPNKPKWSIIMALTVCPNRPKAIVNEAPKGTTVELENRTVKTPITPALYKNIEIFLSYINLDLLIINTNIMPISPTKWIKTLDV